MQKHLILLIPVTGLLMVGMLTRLPNDLWCPATTALEQKKLAYDWFKRGFNQSINSLAQGQIPLREAIAQVHALAQRDCPVYLDTLHCWNPGATLEERIGHNLLSHVRFQIGHDRDCAARMSQLQKELEEVHPVRVRKQGAAVAKEQIGER